MSLRFTIDGHAGQAFAEMIRRLPDASSWRISDVDGPVVVARSERGGWMREAILCPLERGWEVECLVSRGVSEAAVLAVVGAAVGAGLLALGWAWRYGPPGLGGLLFGIVLALTVPAGVITLGRYAIDPGRDSDMEHKLERSLRFAAAQVPQVQILNTDG